MQYESTWHKNNCSHKVSRSLLLTWEVRLAYIVNINHAFHLYCKYYMWIEFFSRSQPDFEGFLRALRFPPSSKSTPSLIHLAVVLCSKVTNGPYSGCHGAPLYAFGSTLFELRRCCTLRRRLAVTVIIIIFIIIIIIFITFANS